MCAPHHPPRTSGCLKALQRVIEALGFGASFQPRSWPRSPVAPRGWMRRQGSDRQREDRQRMRRLLGS